MCLYVFVFALTGMFIYRIYAYYVYFLPFAQIVSRQLKAPNCFAHQTPRQGAWTCSSSDYRKRSGACLGPQLETWKGAPKPFMSLVYDKTKQLWDHQWEVILVSPGRSVGRKSPIVRSLAWSWRNLWGAASTLKGAGRISNNEWNNWHISEIYYIYKYIYIWIKTYKKYTCKEQHYQHKGWSMETRFSQIDRCLSVQYRSLLIDDDNASRSFFITSGWYKIGE